MDVCHVVTDSVMQWGETALHCAASEGHPTVVKMLLSAGAQTDIRDKVSSNWDSNVHEGVMRIEK